jgi:deazaflavin-dependent oxidoreductase (nitroreductase family)
MKNVFKLFLAFHIAVYRLSRGRVFNRVQGLPILLLTTTGRKTNKSRTTPLGYFMDGDRYVITASNAGFDTHPAWFHNLSNNSQVTVEVNGRKIQTRAEVVTSEKRSLLWTSLIKLSPYYKYYEKKTSRVIPLVALQPLINQ